MRLAIAVLALALASPARADISLPGEQHLGDGNSAGFVPSDPVQRAQMLAYPMHFQLSQATTVTAVSFSGLNDLGGSLRVYLDDLATPLAGSWSGSTYTLAAPLTLAAGTHTLVPDGGCTVLTFDTICVGGEDDFDFDGVTLVAAQTSASRSVHRRRHLGTGTDLLDDDYGGRWYPDAPEGISISFTFTTDAARLLAEVDFYHLRDVLASKPAKVYLDNVLIGTLTADGNPYVLASGAALGIGAHTLRIDSGGDDIAWDDIVAVLVNNPAATPGLFDAVDSGGVPGGAITTKQGGNAFTLDLLAVSGGALLPAYTGTVTVELVDASNAALGCAGWPAVASLGTVAFGAADAGRKALTLSHAGVLRDARIRMTDPALGVSGCSSDDFALRPAAFANLAATHADATTAGTAESLVAGTFTAFSTPVHKAGQPFTLQAVARLGDGTAATGYDGRPTAVATELLGAAAGAVSTPAADWSVSAGQLRSDAVSYDEAGAIALELRDTTWAAVDADDSSDAQRYVTGSVTVGRFIPDHFAIAAEDSAAPPSLLAGCDTFSYVGQGLVFSPAPARFRLTAVDAAGNVTANYDNDLYGLPAAAADTVFTAASGTVLRVNAPAPDNALTNLHSGVTRFELLFDAIAFARGSPGVPFDAEIALAPGALGERDGVTVNGSYGTAASGLGMPFVGAGGSPKQQRFGRLVVDNAHGSERLPLDLGLRVESWVASGGFADNPSDSCTSLPQSALSLSGLATAIAGYAPGFISGRTTLRLAAPGSRGQVRVTPDLSAAGLGYLRIDDGDADSAYDDNPVGTATFGIARNNEKRIYQREIVGD